MKQPCIIAEEVQVRPALDACCLVRIPRFTDERGSLSAVEGPPVLPFQPRRLYYLYELPVDAHRGCHAHRTEQEVIVALAGSFKVCVNNGIESKEYELASPDEGLYLPPLIWHDVFGFSPDTVCAVFASELYNPGDYFLKYEDYLQAFK